MIKKYIFVLCFFISFNFLNKNILCTTGNLDGFSSVFYLTDVWTTTDNYARGFVGLNEGFEIGNSAILIELCSPVFGNINLNNKTLILDGDVFLGSDVTLQNGGTISGQNNTIFLGGDLNVPSNITISTNIAIDGQGKTLIFASGVQITVNSGVTLTLRNMVLKNTNSTAMIQFADATSKVIFDNVTVELAADYELSTGAMEVINDVYFTGNSTFKYSSAVALTIDSNSCLYFGNGMTFHNNSGDKDIVSLTSATSSIYFDGCNINMVGTGLRFQKGNVFFDNKVTVNGSSSDVDKGIIFGNGTDYANNATAYFLSGSDIILNGVMNDNCVDS